MTPPQAPSAPKPLNLDDYEIVLPEGLSADALAVAAGTDRAAAEGEQGDRGREPGPAAGRPAVTPPPAGERPGAAAPPGVIAERRKRQAAEQRTTQLEGELASLDARNRQISAELRAATAARAAQPAVAPKVNLTDAERAALRKEVNAKEDQGDIVDRTVEVILGKVNQGLEALTKTTAAAAKPPERDVVAMEEAFIADGHEDYDEVLYRGGVWRKLEKDPRTGLPRDPALNELIMTHPNPPQKAYEVAQHYIAQRAARRTDDGTEPAATEPAAGGERQPAGDASANGAARPAGRDEIAEAERRGAARAVGELADTAAARGRGIRSVPSAGGVPRARVDKAFLDELSRRDPDKFLKVMEANPALEFDYYS